MPRWFVLAVAVLAALALVPFACIGMARVSASAKPRIHLVADMDNQPRFKSQQANPLFADGRAMRPPVPGTVARGQLGADDRLVRGREGERWATAFPIAPTRQVLERGRERYGVFCAPCHGLSGYGDGIVAKRADRLLEGTWVPPSSFHTETVRGRAVGELYDTITNGVRNMPAYGPQIPVEDRWAIVGYVRALQRSQGARMEDVPAELRTGLR